MLVTMEILMRNPARRNVTRGKRLNYYSVIK